MKKIKLLKQNKVLMVLISFLFIIQTIAIVSCSEKTQTVQTDTGEKVITVGAGTGLKAALDPVAQAFTKKTGIKVVYSYLCSAMVLSSMQLTESRDIMIPGSQHYMDIAIKKGIVDPDTVAETGYMIPVIVVPKGNPKNITKIEDLTRPGLRVGVGEPEALAVGRLTEKMLKNLGIYDQVMENVVLTGGSASKLIIPLAMGNLDAEINWKAVSVLFKDKVDTIYIEPAKLMYSVAPIGMTRYTKKKDMAQEYLNFVSSKEGLAIFSKHGFDLYFDQKTLKKVR
jgi:molybdate transport system substrate-binding protein